MAFKLFKLVCKSVLHLIGIILQTPFCFWIYFTYIINIFPHHLQCFSFN